MTLPRYIFISPPVNITIHRRIGIYGDLKPEGAIKRPPHAPTADEKAGNSGPNGRVTAVAVHLNSTLSERKLPARTLQIAGTRYKWQKPWLKTSQVF